MVDDPQPLRAMVSMGYRPGSCAMPLIMTDGGPCSVLETGLISQPPGLPAPALMTICGPLRSTRRAEGERRGLRVDL